MSVSNLINYRRKSINSLKRRYDEMTYERLDINIRKIIIIHFSKRIKLGVS